MATHNKQTSVKNRRMNPPRPASSNRGTVSPNDVKKWVIATSETGQAENIALWPSPIHHFT
jgi:hypothetical protein